MRADSELMVITKSKDLVKYIFTISEKAPKKFRFSLISKMQNNSLDILENLIMANEILLNDDEKNLKLRGDFQHSAIAKLKVLDAIMLTARECNCILPKQYEIMAGLVSDCIKLTRAWIKSDKKRAGR